jgi:hypothetical protein
MTVLQQPPDLTGGKQSNLVRVVAIAETSDGRQGKKDVANPARMDNE